MTVARVADGIGQAGGRDWLDVLRQHRRRAVKIGAAVLLVGPLVIVGLSGMGTVSTSNAVISAQLVMLRAPIAGKLSGATAPVGTPVVRGEVLARVENARADDVRLVDLHAQLARLQAEGVALGAEYDRLLRLRGTFAERGQRHNGAAASRLASLQAEAERDLSARVTQRDRLQQQLSRRAALEASGFAAHDEVDQIRAALRVAGQQAAAAQARLDSAAAEALAARSGVFSAPGANDVPYSVQRADEVDLHLSALAREIAFLGGAQAETRERLAAETRRHAFAAGTELAAPTDAIVWQVDAAEGELLAQGDPAVGLVDCNAALLLAAIPRERAGEIELGGIARFRVAGRDEELGGRVLSVTGDFAQGGASHLAATPLPERGPTSIVRVAAPTSPNRASGCLVGASARVSLPTLPRGAFGWLQAVFGRWT